MIKQGYIPSNDNSQQEIFEQKKSPPLLSSNREYLPCAGFESLQPEIINRRFGYKKLIPIKPTINLEWIVKDNQKLIATTNNKMIIQNAKNIIELEDPIEQRMKKHTKKCIFQRNHVTTKQRQLFQGLNHSKKYNKSLEVNWWGHQSTDNPYSPLVSQKNSKNLFDFLDNQEYKECLSRRRIFSIQKNQQSSNEITIDDILRPRLRKQSQNKFLN